MRPDTATAPAPATRRPDPAPPAPGPAVCWYRDPTHRPALAWCPPTCHGPLVFAERVGARDGDLHTYCDTHGSWRRRSIHLPSLVRRITGA